MRACAVLCLGLILLMAIPAVGVQRTVLVEQFTNSGCPGCNSIKDSMVVLYEQKVNEGKIVPILYHTWWPNENDAFWLFNQTEIYDRIMYYAGIPPWIDQGDTILYVPSFRFDGKYHQDPSDVADWYDYFVTMCDSLVTEPSPLRIDIGYNSFSADSDSVYVSFDVVAEDSADFNMSLRLAVTEWRHRYPVPIGKHDHAFRDFVPDADGYALGPMLPGQSLHFDWAYVVDPEYRTDRLVTNIFVQRNGTRKVQQAIREEPAAHAGIDVGDVIGPVSLGTISPNPFSTQTTITYDVRREGEVQLSVYTLTGRLVTDLVDGRVSPGRHSVTWDGRDRFGREVGSGVYYYSLKTDRISQTGKMIVLR